MLSALIAVCLCSDSMLYLTKCQQQKKGQQNMKTISKQKAQALGLDRYFTGKPCIHGHIAERYVLSGMCVDCAKARAQRTAICKGGDRALILEKTGGKCFYCGKVLNKRNFCIDHFVPVCLGGRDVKSNVVPACKSCNGSKNRHDIEVWRKNLAYMKEGRPKINDKILEFLAKKNIFIPEPPKHIFWYEKNGYKTPFNEGGNQ